MADSVRHVIKTLPRVLVTGASGFLGSEIVRLAETLGVPVMATSRHRPKGTAASTFAAADLRTPSELAPLVAGIDVVVHAAGLAHAPHAPASAFEQINVEGTRNVMQAAARARVRRVVLV